VQAQERLARLAPEPWRPPRPVVLIGGCFVCFGRGASGRGARGEAAWAAATLTRNRRPLVTVVTAGQAGAAYEPGLLALREGPILEAAVRSLPESPEVLLVNATGRDHPRRAGLALHLGIILGLPSVGVTDRPLVARGVAPRGARGASAPLVLDGEVVGHLLVTRPGARPIAVHAGWRTDPEVAARTVIASVRRARTPEPLRRARHAARLARAASSRAAG
jgi:deoxyribonuclease V